jgi:hypothetical protein
MTLSHPIVFLLDVDNTLLDNDGIQQDLKDHLERAYELVKSSKIGAALTPHESAAPISPRRPPASVPQRSGPTLVPTNYGYSVNTVRRFPQGSWMW